MASSRIAYPVVRTQNQKTRRRRIHMSGMLYILPSVLFVLVFFLRPLFMTFYLSLTDWNLLRGGNPTFIGLENYHTLLTDTTFWSSLRFTILYTLVITPVLLLVSFGLALLTQQARRGVSFFRTAYFLPVVLGLNATSLIWLWLYNDDVGIINALARRIHLLHGPLIWFTSFTSTLIAICIMIVWKTSGFSMILLASGMQAISQEMYGAARVDGANALQRMWYITLPLLRRTFALTLTLSVIGSFLAFDQFFIMSKGGPQNQTITTVYWIYNQAFTQYHLGYGSALAIVLLVLLVGISVVQLYLLRDRD